MKRSLIVLMGLLLSAANLFSLEQPFRWQGEIRGNKLIVTAVVPPSYYFYRSTLIFDVQGENGKILMPVKFPSGKVVADDMFGKVEVYGAGQWQWEFISSGPFVKGSVNFQGCRAGTADSPGMCFMPETVNILPGGTPAEKWENKTALLPLSLDGFVFERKLTGLHNAADFLSWLEKGTVSGGTAASAGSHSFWFLALIALLGGLGLNLTPCILPMLPITLAIIGAGGASGRRGFFRGLLYGAGMTVSYGVLGLAVILAGARFGDLQSSMSFNFAIAVIFILLGLAMLGVFNLDLSRASAGIRPNAIRGGKEITAFVMGCVSSLLAGACVAPVAVSVLVFASARYQSDGAAALLLPFLLGAGMALPWPFAGAGLAVLPKPGRFMVRIKYLFALFIFGAAFWYAWTGWQLRPGVWDAEKEIRMLDASLASAAAEKKDVIIDFGASWCKNCAAMDKVLQTPAVEEKLKHFRLIRFRAESFSDSRIAALLKKWDIPGLPAFVMLKHK